MQKMPLMSPVSVIKSHPCCLPQFPLVSAEDEHVHLTHKKLESGTREQRSSHAAAASLQEGTAGWEERAGARFCFALAWGMFVPALQQRQRAPGGQGLSVTVEQRMCSGLSSALQREGSSQAGERGCRQAGSCCCRKVGCWEPRACLLVAQPICRRACGLCSLCAFPGSCCRC